VAWKKREWKMEMAKGKGEGREEKGGVIIEGEGC